MDKDRLLEFADAFAFVGNSLLKPMSQTQSVGLDPVFWVAFPDFGSDDVARRADECSAFADDAQAAMADGNDVVEQVSVEFTKLFIGPPAPAAPPWETMNCEEGVSVGFGKPTIDMQNILASLGLEVSNENNQYADHMGLELLTLSEMCRRAASGDMSFEEVRSFAIEHPLSWTETLCSKVGTAYPEGYFVRMLGLSQALLEEFVR